MSEVKVHRHIEAPPEVVFAAVTDFARAHEKVEAIQRVEMLTDGPVGVGTSFRETRRVFNREATEEMEVTAFDPPRSYTLECESHGCRFSSEFRLAPNGSGTDLEMSFAAEPVSFLAKAMSGMMKPMMGKMAELCEKDLDDLKAAIESR